MIKWTYFIIILFFQSFAANIYINQEGYTRSSSKFVVVDQPANSFFLIDINNQNIVYSASLDLHIANDPSTNFTIYRGEFSNFNVEGEYKILVPEIGQSHQFEIADSVYNSTFKKSLKGFYFQRCGTGLNNPFAGNYFHALCHIADGFFHVSTGFSGYHLAKGGWHDAGDYGKYIVNAGITVGTLLMAYEYFPSKFASDDIYIPESGNNIPDLLDEARYEVDWFLKMQNTDGGVFFKLSREQFSGFIMPQNDNETRYVYELSSTATADFAAVMARASRIFAPYDTSFSNDCLTAALSAWQFLENNPSVVPTGGFQNPNGTATGQYGDTYDLDERLWAAAELFLTTSDSVYNNYFINNYTHAGLFSAEMSWSNVNPLALLTYLFGNQNNINTQIQSDLNVALINYCQSLVIQRNNSGFSVLLNPGEYNWGSNSRALNRAILLILGFEKSHNTEFNEVALDQLNYILGNNAHNISFLTATGDIYPMFIHHRPSIADGIIEPVPGLLAGGPDEYLEDPVLQSYFNSSTPPALCYIDDQGSYASNEIAINWNASLVFVAGYFAEGLVSEIPNSDKSHQPEKLKLFNNYPNPFNGATYIKYYLPKSDFVSIKIYNSSGQLIDYHKLGQMPSGDSVFLWNVSNISEKTLSSGVYYSLIETSESSNVQKMIYLK